MVLLAVGERYLIEDEAKLIGPQRPLWRVGFSVDQTRSQACHCAVIDYSAVLERKP